MKYAISLLILAFIIAIGCNTNKKSRPFSKDNLPVEKFTVNTGQDTVIQTQYGALLKIPAGTLENKNGGNVTLEIKEAYSIEQIIEAGLFTQSNGQPLSSGGMIYINASAGQEVIFKQKINIAIPADYLQKGMELYKGEEKSDGTVNWVKPDTLPENKQLTSVERGKIYFESHCRSCHQIGKDATGPNLAHLKKRFKFGDEGQGLYYLHQIEVYRLRDQYYSNHFKSDSSKKLDYNDKIDIYKCNVRKMFGSVGPAFPDLERGDSLRDIVNYIQTESDRLNLPLPSHAFLLDCVDSCKEYNKQTAELRRLKSLSEQERQKFIKDNGEMTVLKPDSLNPRLNEQGFIEKVSPENFDATYYQFTVSSFGWFNIDLLLNDLDGVKQSELLVRITGQYKDRVNLFLIIPSVKVYGEGGPANGNSGKYAFFTKDGKIPLPQNEKAYILAITEQSDKIAYILKEFTTNLQQEFDVELKASSKEQFKSAMKSFDIARLHIKVDKSKNSDSIRAKDKEIKDIDARLKQSERLKPKRCDCNCITGTYPAIADTSKK